MQVTLTTVVTQYLPMELNAHAQCVDKNSSKNGSLEMFAINNLLQFQTKASEETCNILVGPLNGIFVVTEHQAYWVQYHCLSALFYPLQSLSGSFNVPGCEGSCLSDSSLSISESSSSSLTDSSIVLPAHTTSC